MQSHWQSAECLKCIKCMQNKCQNSLSYESNSHSYLFWSIVEIGMRASKCWYISLLGETNLLLQLQSASDTSYFWTCHMCLDISVHRWLTAVLFLKVTHVNQQILTLLSYSSSRILDELNHWTFKYGDGALIVFPTRS